MNYKRWSLIAVLTAMAVMILAACTTTETVTETVEVTRIVEEVITVAGEEVVVTVETVVEVTREVVDDTASTGGDTEEEVGRDLIVCMAQEPETLYTYGGSMLAQRAVEHAFTENLLTNLSYGYQAQALEKLPRLDDGDAVINSVEVSAGALVADVNGEAVELADGVVVKNSAGEEVTFDGTPVMMDQMVVTFVMKQMYWSDGEPVTADDSVFAFEIASSPDTPSSKFGIERTASYVALDDLTLEWTGIPGWRDSTYFTNVWGPQPRHYIGDLTPLQMLDDEKTTRMPLSYGAFQVVEWEAGSRIVLERNEYYYRADEGLPYLDTLTYKFIPDTNAMVANLLAGSCDIGTQDGMDVGQSEFLIEAEANGLLVPYFQTGTVFEHIDFNIDPYDPADTVWFADVRVRQAMTMCTDRQSMVDNILYGRSEVIHTFIPSVHPLYPDGLTEWPYDTERANALLDEAGFVDTDADGIRNHPETGEKFSVLLGTTSGNEMRQQLTQIFQQNMADCGIEITLDYVPSSEWFADGPEGPLFGRQFQLGEFAWLTGVEPSCDLYITAQIPGPIEEGFAGWGGANESGWSNPEYDAVCQAALGSLPGTASYEDNHKEAQRIFSENVPVIPLFLRLKVAAARPEVCNFSVDPTQNSELWNIFEIGLGGCE